MSSSTRNLLLAAGALWGFLLALALAMVAFAGPLNPSPVLVSALLCASLSGTVGAWTAGRLANRARSLRRKDGWPRWLLSGFVTGVSPAAVAGVLAALSIWLAMTVTMTGFSPATPRAIHLLVSQPSMFLQSAIVARAVFIYALLADVALAPFTGLAVNRMAQRGVVAR